MKRREEIERLHLRGVRPISVVSLEPVQDVRCRRRISAHRRRLKGGMIFKRRDVEPPGQSGFEDLKPKIVLPAIDADIRELDDRVRY